MEGLYYYDRNKRGKILEKLAAEYPEAKTELNYTTPFELLVATILSAQTTDKQVNKVTAELFKNIIRLRILPV